MIKTVQESTLSAPFFGRETVGLPATHLGETQQLLNTLDKVQRLTQLDNILKKANRKTTIEKLEKLWSTPINSNVEESKATLLKGLEGSFRFLAAMKEFYKPRIEAAENCEDLEKLKHQAAEDATTLRFLSDSPLTKSHRGQNGPTFLVRYPAQNDSTIKPHFHQYVIKWSHWNELGTTRLYDLFSKSLSFPFHVPQASALDLHQGIHEITDTSRDNLELTAIEQLKQRVDGIRFAAAPENQEPKDKLILFIERIAAANLFDFAHKEYIHLSDEQMQELYVGLGRLAMLDLFTGNTDRLIQSRYDAASKKFELDTMQSNLGNVLVQRPQKLEEPLNLYAIDNGLDERFFSDSECNSSYNAFVQELLSRPNEVNRLTTALVASLQKGVEVQAEEVGGKMNAQEDIQLKEQLKPFIEDLAKESTKSAIAKGMEEMSLQLHQIHSNWNDESSKPLKQYLFTTYSELLNVVSGRFSILNSVRSS